ncbi:MAG: hypothetical protein AAB400_01515 [Patescibacteria group bacterium]
MIVVVMAVVFCGLSLFSNRGESTKYNNLPVKEIVFLGPNAKELGAQVNKILNDHRTQVPTGSITLHGNLMWLKTPNGPQHYGLAVQFNDGSGIYTECPVAEKNHDKYIWHVAELLMKWVPMDRSTR